MKFWPRRWVRQFRQHCTRTPPLNYFLPPLLPKDARVVIFPCIILPSHAIEGRWGDRYDAGTPAQHVAAIFRRRTRESMLRYLRHYIKPSPWVRDAWRE